jgi:Uma2 family endonuclease
VVFEVLSTETSYTDRIVKLREYTAAASVQRYVILEWESVAAMVFVRNEGGFAVEVLTEGDTLRMPEIGVEVPMAAFYVDIEPGNGTA